MAHPYHHALSSVRKWGGCVADYQPIHDWFDGSKMIIADFRHRALRHHAEGIFMAETIFGATITLSTGRVIPTRWVGEQHVMEDLGRIPGFADWVKAIRPEPWMGRGQKLDLEDGGNAMTLATTLRFENGTFACIHYDSDVEQPFQDDCAVRIVVLHRRYIDPSQGGCGRSADEVAEWEQENAAEWFAIKLFLYDHSGTVYRVGQGNPFSCPWDSGRVGIIALKRSEWGNGGETDGTLTEYAQGVAAEYTSWANGECYGYVLHDSSGELIESCWGFIGRDRTEQEAIAAAADFAGIDIDPVD